MNKQMEKRMQSIKLERRRFLATLSRACISSAALKASGLAAGIMGARGAVAQDYKDKKFLLIYQPGGAPAGRYKDLGFSGAALAPFAAHADSVRVREMTISRPGGHGIIFQAAGANSFSSAEINSSTVDQQIAQVIGNFTPFRSIQLGVQSGDSAGINRLRGQALPRINSPSLAVDEFFVGAPTANNKRLSALDVNRSSLEVLGAKLTAEERERLNQHLAALENLENRITAVAENSSCEAPQLAEDGSGALATYRNQADIAVTALQCGLTNVASIQFSDTQAAWYPNDGSADAVAWNGDHHTAMHSGGFQYLPEIVGYMNKGVAHAIQGLKNAGIYDKTVVLVISDMGDAVSHTAANGPIVVASGIPGHSGGIGDDYLDGADHYRVFSEVFSLLGIESYIGSVLYDYG